MPPHARAVLVGRGHRFAAYPRCSADSWGGTKGETGMLVLLVTLLLQASVPCPVQASSEPPSLIVQAVDTTWLPLPGMQVTVTPTKPRGTPIVADTKRDGFAEFALPRNAEYAIEVVSPGFKRNRVKSVRIGPVLEYTSTAYVQVKLQVEAPRDIID
jgi:hypothetical protein